MSEPQLFQRRVPQAAPVTPASMSLLRLGERCDHRCPMCSNTGRPELQQLETDKALARVAHLHSLGFRKVMLTGGEPTLHRGFWTVVGALQERGMRWDVNTHGVHLGQPGAAKRARDAGLERAIVSLHDHEAGPSSVMSGIPQRRHPRILAGVDALVAAGVAVTVNRVCSKVTLGRLDAYLRFAAQRWGPAVGVKVCFPGTAGKGGGWAGVDLRYSEVQAEARAAVPLAQELGLPLAFEAFPSCIVGVATRRDLGRSGWGETHYLDDASGQTVWSMRFLESKQRYFGAGCRACPAITGCAGLSRQYAARHGTHELQPFPHAPA